MRFTVWQDVELRFPEELRQWVLQLSRRRAPRWVVAAAGLTGVAAAVALSAVPAAEEPPQGSTQVIVEQVASSGVVEQLEALAGLDLELTYSEVTRSGTPLDSTLRRLGISDPVTLVALRRDSQLTRAIDGKGGRLIQARVGSSGNLKELVVRMPAEDPQKLNTHFKRLRWLPVGGRWAVQADTVPLVSTPRLASATITSSLFAATDDARIPESVALQIAEIFAVDIDFHRELRKGDSFSIVYEALTADGEPVPWSQGAGRVLAAEFINARRAYQAVWFERDGKGAYFDAQGRSRKKTFLASPLEFSRVSSGFAMRMHPILQQMRAHKGVDYAAPPGTPVRVVGNGTVQFAGWQSGFGKVVFVSHGNDRTTVYAHLSRIDVRQGQRVSQGDRIGAVGATGWATGPHLHFEFRVGGVHKDPLTIAKASESVEIDAASRTAFAAVVKTFTPKLELAEAVRGRPAFE